MRKILFAVLSLSLGNVYAQIDTSKKIETVPTVISDTPVLLPIPAVYWMV